MSEPGLRYRPNVCAVITDDLRSQVLVFRRVDATLQPHVWQFPQGGLDAGEAPEAGLLRELVEEIGTGDVEVLASLPQPVRYAYPPEIQAALSAKDPEKAKYQGQAQHWFLVHLRGGTSSIHFDHQPQEFDAFRWVSPEEALALVTPFKREAYRQGLTGFALI